MSQQSDRFEAERLQLAVVNHNGSAYVNACPGAGKTRTLVHRVERIIQSSLPRKGIAILSFTNTAVDEFKARCHSHGIIERIGFPNFIGTFDGFLNQFLVLPFGVPGCTTRPVIVDSWKNIFVIPKGGGKGIELSRFDATTGKLDLSKNRDVAGLVKDKLIFYERSAYGYRSALNKKGLLCADDARRVAKEFLSEKSRADRIGKALAARFHEVIVDEAQDCNADDVAVLEWLKSHGISLIVVCDPDQAIFEFRKGSTGDLQTFVKGFQPLTMNGNFRSSKIICTAAGTMRTKGTTDLAVGDHHDTPHPVILIPYGKTPKSEIGTKFKTLAADLEVTDIIVLAHKRRFAERASGVPHQPSASDRRLARLARLVVAFHSPASSGKQREATLRGMIRLLMELENWEDDDVASLRPLTESPESDRVFRRKAITVLAGLPTTHARIGVNGWAEEARALVAKMVTMSAGKSIKQALPSTGDWHKELEVPPAVGISCATVHEAKGRDYDGVCLVLEKDSEGAVSDWENRATATSEALRVLYVGATRAKKLLAIALPTDLLPRVEAILTSGGVPLRIETLESEQPKARKKPPRKASPPEPPQDR